MNTAQKEEQYTEAFKQRIDQLERERDELYARQLAWTRREKKLIEKIERLEA